MQKAATARERSVIPKRIHLKSYSPFQYSGAEASKCCLSVFGFPPISFSNAWLNTQMAPHQEPNLPSKKLDVWDQFWIQSMMQRPGIALVRPPCIIPPVTQCSRDSLATEVPQSFLDRVGENIWESYCPREGISSDYVGQKDWAYRRHKFSRWTPTIWISMPVYKKI